MPDYPDCWQFDENRRVYRKDGRGGPIWREHWLKVEIIGENRVSWLTACHRKIPKKGGRGIAFDRETIEREAFIQENRHSISRKVDAITDYELLRKVADLIGYIAESAQ